jgi:hypothetical protein
MKNATGGNVFSAGKSLTERTLNTLSQNGFKLLPEIKISLPKYGHPMGIATCCGLTSHSHLARVATSTTGGWKN